MIQKDPYYTEQVDRSILYDLLDSKYSAESDLCRSVLLWSISDCDIKTRYELDLAYETVCDLNEWPEGEGYGSSDRAHDLRSIIEAVEHSRKYLKAEKEMMIINKLDREPLVGKVLEYMSIGERLEKGLKEGVQ